MPRKSVTIGAIIGSTLMALSLVGSYGNPASFTKSPDKKLLAERERLHALGKAAAAEGRYQDARDAYASAAAAAVLGASPYYAAMDWSNAGYCAKATMQYQLALEDLLRARSIAETARQLKPLIYALDNLADLYLLMNQPANALRIAQDALSGPAGHADARQRAELFFQEARALAGLDRFAEAQPLFRQAMPAMAAAGELDVAARGWAIFGRECINRRKAAGAERKDRGADCTDADAEWALNESLHLAGAYHLKATAFALTQLARLRSLQGKRDEAERLFRQALDAHEALTPLYAIYCERGSSRLDAGRNSLALADFRTARRLAMRMRADMVPADQDRVSMEQMGDIFEGFVDAGNQLALSNRDKTVLAETFDVAEMDRMWSLRALIPEANDWRSRLPQRYWDLLTRFQSTERSLLAETHGSRDRGRIENQAGELDLELQQLEAAAGAGAAKAQSAGDISPSAHVKSVLDPDAVLFSFSITTNRSWLWTVDRERISVYALPKPEELRKQVESFKNAVQQGGDSASAGRALYKSLFGSVPASTLSHKRWLIEPDGPLYDVPFEALSAGDAKDGRSAFLIERAALETIPGALLLESGKLHASGSFVGIADPVFNTADSRYTGRKPKVSSTAVMLPRLPNTGPEIDACSRAWGSASPRLLKGAAADIGTVESALSASPAVIHFATHVIAGTDEYRSGLIALGLNANGAMGLLGPKDIVARRIAGSLVVMDACYSGQGKALPGSGLMGLTRAWIGAGASAVVSTRWDVADEAAQSLMVNFYRALHDASGASPAEALRSAQLAALRSGGPDRQPARWAGYFLLSRIQ